jgi:membrane protease YdiL (CAAX protease family)
MRSVPLIALAAVFITYLLGMFIVPDLAPFRSLQAALPWVTGGVVSQTFFLITSLLLMRWVGRKPFRVYGFRLADRRSVLIPALLFSLGHLCLIGLLDSVMLLSVLIMTFGIGWLAGYWRQKTGSLLQAYLIHFTANAVGSGLPLLLTRLMS